MKRAPLPGVDPSIYLAALPLLVRNPSIVIVPLLMAVIGILVGRLFTPGGADLGGITGGILQLFVFLLMLFGLGTACIIADDAWRHGRASFENGWVEARRRAPEILMAAIGVSFVLAIGQYASALLGAIGYLLLAAAAFFLIFAIPAAAVGGVPGGAAIQVSIDRVRANPLSAALATIVTIGLVIVVTPMLTWLAPYLTGFSVIGSLIEAVFQAIFVSYSALIVTKSYTDAAFGRRF